MMRGEGIFKAGIAVAPFTWKYYDTIYSERYLQRPQDNPEGYSDNSIITNASKLQGNYLLVHGTGDDNVHYQISMELVNKLVDSGKQFQSFFYPDKAHGIRGEKTRTHLFTMMTKFVTENL
jgi:dipeptidyl-peptidase-4